MAYNREWDQGKDTWAEGSWGGSYNDRGNVRGREDDYYNEGKRRKYNNGGFQPQNAVSGSEDAGPGRLGHPGAHDYGQDDRRGPGFKKRLVPSEPSPHVIFLGLDPDFTESDLQAYLSSNGCSVETVTIIRDRSTGVSKGFGFAQFATTEHARGFVDPLFPFIQVPPPASHGASASAAFYKALEANTPHNGRRVKIDYSQSATPHDKGRANRGNTNDGTRDIGNSQGPVLLFRGLDPLSGPQAIHQAMLYSSGPNTKGAKGMRRIILIKDKVTMASFGFAFVEFVDTISACAVLAATMDSAVHPSGFRISDRPVAASFAHPHSFQPVTDFLSRDEACLQSTTSLGGTVGNWVRYWDESSTVAVLEFKVEEPATANVTSKEKREKKKKVDLESNALRPLPLAPSTLPVSDKPLTLSFGKSTSKPNAPKSLSIGFSMDDSPPAEDAESLEDTSPEVKKITGQKVAPLIASKKTANNITKWNQVQEELTSQTSPPEPASVPSVQAATPPTEVKNLDYEFEFSDTVALMCLLCSRQFKSLDQLKRHNKESELHKKNMKDGALQDLARSKLALRKAQVSDQPKYRDRASERRVLFNQPDAPAIERDVTHKGKKHDGPLPAPSPPPPSVNPGEDANNVGNKLLKMMGWTEGSGLGTNGEGRVDPIPTAVYASGVGLGASKGKDISKYTEGYSGYVQMAQDAARQRYEG